MLMWMVVLSYKLVSVDSVEPSCNPQYDILKTIAKLEQKLKTMEYIIKEQQNFITKYLRKVSGVVL